MAISLDHIRSAFYGLDTEYPLLDGRTARRVYLDSSASTLMMKPAHEAAQAYLEHYANTHTTVHTSAHITHDTMQWAYDQVLSFFGANKDDYASVFLGSGATAAMNRLASGLAELRPHRGTVLVSSMEHHSNDLPHRKYARQVEYIPLKGRGANIGAVDLQALEEMLIRHQGDVNYVAVTGVSNVTGILNPLKEIAHLAHEYDAYIVVDAAQMAAHAPAEMSANELDFLVFSGHKVYVPGSPGALVARKNLLTDMSPREVGGGMVSKVTSQDYFFADDLVEREQAGTPNILGAITLACVLDVLQKIGMQDIYEKELDLVSWATGYLLMECPYIRIYGDLSHARRVGSMAFNLSGIPHGLVAAVLNDFHGIAVRNECFCAHPYVHGMLFDEFVAMDMTGMSNDQMEEVAKLHRGMVRASFGLYTTRDDIYVLAEALKDIHANEQHYRSLYEVQDDGSFLYKNQPRDLSEVFDIRKVLQARCSA
jgi:selenocysteine lyase/cysteine desulfurase